MRAESFFDRITLSIPDDWAWEEDEDGRIICFADEGEGEEAAPAGVELWLDYQELTPPNRVPLAEMITASRGFAEGLREDLGERKATSIRSDELPDGALVRYVTTDVDEEGAALTLHWWHRFGAVADKVFLVTAQILVPEGLANSDLMALSLSLNREMPLVKPR